MVLILWFSSPESPPVARATGAVLVTVTAILLLLEVCAVSGTCREFYQNTKTASPAMLERPL
jgi:hypothetical protein